MELAELEQALRAADPAAFLIKPRFLRRVIKHDRQPPGIGLQVPHRKSHVIAREKLLAIVAHHELGVPDGVLLPDILYLIAKPYPHKLNTIPREPVLVKYWRLLFHCRIHDALGRRFADLKGRPAEIQRRIHALGATAFDEVRRVLRQENYSLPPGDDWTVYEEFAAVYLEQRFFTGFLLPHFFPAIRDFDRIDALLSEDVNARVLFETTRLAGAPDNPALASVNIALEAARDTEAEDPTAAAATVSNWRAERLRKKAERAAAMGNAVRAAIYREQAARLSAPDVRGHHRDAARAALAALVGRLQSALDLEPRALQEWRQALPPLLVHAAAGRWPVEARLLYDLQRACMDHERGIYAVDLPGWLLSFGRRPLKRPLPRLREVHLVKHLRKASARLAGARLSDADRQALASLLHAAVHRCEVRLRERFRPLVAAALAECELAPANYPERIALNKLTEEILDRIAERGFMNIGDLRDAVSRNGLKLPDLSGPVEFVRGDRLLKIDRALARLLDGVYRRGEIYMRWLQSLSSLAFGTLIGRVLTLYLILPFGGAFVALKGAQEIVHLTHKLTGPALERALPAVVGATTVGLMGTPLQAGGDAEILLPTWVEHTHARALEASILTPAHLIGIGLLLFGVLHVPRFRRGLGRLLKWLWLVLRGLCYDVPAAFYRLALVQRLFQTTPFVFFYRYLLTPLVIAAFVWPILALYGFDPLPSLRVSGAVFLVLILALNSRIGRDLEEAIMDWLMRSFDRIRFGILPGIFHFIMDLFKRMLEVVDRLLYTVDEWLRFKAGESALTLAIKAVLGTVWLVVTYFIRIYVNLLIEPTVNPIKHFPVVTVGHKIMAPLIPQVYWFLEGLFSPLGRVIAIPAAVTTLFFVPGIFGFIVWELKENWRLYRANRPRSLKPALIGHHGETMIRLLRPGIHSGTLPKLFARLRKAERGGHRTGNWRAVHKQLDALHHVEACIRRFVERELVEALAGSRGWQLGPRVRPGALALGSNKVSIELACPSFPNHPVWIAFEDRAGWLVAGVEEPGWAAHLSPEQARLLATALAGLYKLAGAQLIREQIEACFDYLPVAYDIAPEGLVVRRLPAFADEAIYQLGPNEVLQPQTRAGAVAEHFPTLMPRQRLFSQVPLLWERWVEAWEQDQAGIHPLKEVVEGVRILPCSPGQRRAVRAETL